MDRPSSRPETEGLLQWRWFSGWTEPELEGWLQQARALGPNFPDRPEEMTLEAGWGQVRSESVLGREPPGPPQEDGLFARARSVLETFDFSDPRIVRWHFSAREPLQGRTVLLELKSLGEQLRYLCGVRVGGTRLEQGEDCSVFGFRFETLQGHIEAGCEWFLLKKDHASGEVRFRIEASWRPGDFPNWWSHLGFSLVGRRYQRAWHRLTHVRLRELTLHAPERVGRATQARGLEHSGHALEMASVRFYAQRAGGSRRAQTEQEVETVYRGRWWTPLGLGVLAGMRSMSAPTLVSRRLARSPQPRTGRLARALSRPWVPRVLGVLALGELVADKLPFVPSRVEALPLAGRLASGALAASASVAGQRRGALLAAAALGAAAAVASSWAFYSLRRLATRRLHVPATAAALTEDALVVALASRLLPTVESRAG